MRTLSLFCRNETLPPWNYGLEINDTGNVSLTSSLFRGFVFVAAITENSDSHKQDVGNGSKVFNAFMARSGYSRKTFIQNIGRVVV